MKDLKVLRDVKIENSVIKSTYHIWKVYGYHRNNCRQNAKKFERPRKQRTIYYNAKEYKHAIVLLTPKKTLGFTKWMKLKCLLYYIKYYNFPSYMPEIWHQSISYLKK